MNRIHIPSFLLALLCACTLEKVDLGQQALEGDSAGSSEGGSSSDDTAGVTVGSDASTTEAAHGLGSPCDHGIEPGELPPESQLLTFPALDCAGLICLYSNDSEPPHDTCTDDASCNTANPGVGQFECVLPEGECRLGRAYLLEHSRCSQACEIDDDCVAPGETNCMGGFSCTVQSVVGEYACRPVCACNDDVDVATWDERTQECIDGTSPGCTQNPGQGLCPD